jgi:MFS family permease
MVTTEEIPRTWWGIGRRTPLVIVICGCLIGMLTFGPRSSVGFFMQPMSLEFSWGRDVFALAFAVQNLLWGIGQPFAGAIADKFGAVRVISVGALMYAIGLLIMRYSNTPLELNVGAGLFVGFGLSGCSFNLVLAAFGKLMPPEWRGSRSAPAPRPGRSGNSCSRRSPWR